ncbi:E3 ubiquitin-protein ligase RMND5A-like isoform X1 [Artemia franciscana]|uniref:E3 ubiquitin-protein ligase RMND5A-like isoform X1 n=1 Tax=Artemia franciscana TaxID=6661 RepID=UPI0032DA615A
MDLSPYHHHLYPLVWADVSETFMRDACTLLGLSIDSPLAVCVNAGCVTLPALLKMKQVMTQSQLQGMWTSKDELPAPKTGHDQKNLSFWNQASF